MLITFAKCCRPIPGDPIIAHVRHGKGLVIHHESCRNITFAKCCRPIPGDPIIAHVRHGKGLVIHHESCRNIRGYQKEP